MKNNVTVVAARKSDRHEIARLFKQLYSGKGEDEAPYYSYFDDVDPTYVKFDHKLFIAKEGNKTIGFCWAMYYEHVKKKGITMIEEMIVDKKYRGKGVGSSLIREVVKYSKKIGSLAIFVTAGGKKAGKFYEKAGFEQLSNYYVKPL